MVACRSSNATNSVKNLVAGSDSAVSSMSRLAAGSSQVRFPCEAPFTSCQTVTGERVSTEYWLTA